jgi:hypothetical protein
MPSLRADSAVESMRVAAGVGGGLGGGLIALLICSVIVVCGLALLACKRKRAGRDGLPPAAATLLRTDAPLTEKPKVGGGVADESSTNAGTAIDSRVVLAAPAASTIDPSAAVAAPASGPSITPSLPSTSRLTTSRIEPTAGSTAGRLSVHPSATEVDPESAHAASKARLRAYERDFVSENGRKPRLRSEWGVMWGEYERYQAARQQASERRKTPARFALAVEEVTPEGMLGEQEGVDQEQDCDVRML